MKSFGFCLAISLGYYIYKYTYVYTVRAQFPNKLAHWKLRKSRVKKKWRTLNKNQAAVNGAYAPRANEMPGAAKADRGWQVNKKQINIKLTKRSEEKRNCAQVNKTAPLGHGEADKKCFPRSEMQRPNLYISAFVMALSSCLVGWLQMKWIRPLKV